MSESACRLLSPRRAADLLDEVVFAHVAELIDLTRLCELEEMLAAQVGLVGANRGAAILIAQQLIDRALVRVAQTRRHIEVAHAEEDVTDEDDKDDDSADERCFCCGVKTS